MFYLLDSPAGYALFERTSSGEATESSSHPSTDLASISALATLQSFLPLPATEDPAQSDPASPKNSLTKELAEFLKANLPQGKEVVLGVGDQSLAISIQEALGVKTEHNGAVKEFITVLLQHFPVFLREFVPKDGAESAETESPSPKRKTCEALLVQAVAQLGELNLSLETFLGRVKEWYGWHFPELAKLVPDGLLYARCVQVIGLRSTFDDGKLKALQSILNVDQNHVLDIHRASTYSMGVDITETDLLGITRMVESVLEIEEHRTQLREFVDKRVTLIAPNLVALVGTKDAARLISHAGSLSALASSSKDNIAKVMGNDLKKLR